MEGRIYYHRNKANGMCYVGQTKQSRPQDRWNYNGCDYHKTSKFGKAIAEYGWNSFEHIILPTVYTTEEELDNAEMETIANLNSIENGYNVTRGGKGTLGSKRTDESKKKMSAKKLGKRLSPEHRAHISEALRLRERKPETFEKISQSKKRYYAEHPEAREFISALHKGMKHTAESRAKMSIKINRYYESAEAREKASKARRGRKASEETKRKMSISMTGKKRTEETKRRIKESWNRRKEKTPTGYSYTNKKREVN